MSNRNYIGSRIYTGHAMPVMLDCNFTVTPSNAAGITNLVGAYVKNVFMNSSSPGGGNPDPVNGTIVVQLNDIYSRIYAVELCGATAPASGSDIKIDDSAMTAGTAYTITTLGDASLAKWRAIGVPVGITPAVGVTFIAASNGGAGDVLTSRVQASAAAGTGVASVEMLGNPQLLITPSATAGQSYGSSIILQCRDYAGAAVAPATGSTLYLRFYLSNSSVTVNGN